MIFNSNEIYAIGGISQKNLKQATCEKYNLSNKNWEKIDSMNLKRSDFNYTNSKNFLYVIGGTDSQEKNLLIESFNILRNKWTILKIKLNIQFENLKILALSKKVNYSEKILEDIIIFGNNLHNDKLSSVLINIDLHEIHDCKDITINPENYIIFDKTNLFIFEKNNFKEAEKYDFSDWSCDFISFKYEQL